VFPSWHFAHSDRNGPLGLVNVVNGSEGTVTSWHHTGHRAGPAIVTSYNGRYLVFFCGIAMPQKHCNVPAYVSGLSVLCPTEVTSAFQIFDIQCWQASSSRLKGLSQLRGSTENDLMAVCENFCYIYGDDRKVGIPVPVERVTRGQRHSAKAAPNDPAHIHVAYTARAAADLSRVTDRLRLTDTANIGENSQHLMHSMQSKNYATFY